MDFKFSETTVSSQIWYDDPVLYYGKINNYPLNTQYHPFEPDMKILDKLTKPLTFKSGETILVSNYHSDSITCFHRLVLTQNPVFINDLQIDTKQLTKLSYILSFKEDEEVCKFLFYLMYYNTWFFTNKNIIEFDKIETELYENQEVINNINSKPHYNWLVQIYIKLLHHNLTSERNIISEYSKKRIELIELMFQHNGYIDKTQIDFGIIASYFVWFKSKYEKENNKKLKFNKNVRYYRILTLWYKYSNETLTEKEFINNVKSVIDDLNPYINHTQKNIKNIYKFEKAFDDYKNNNYDNYTIKQISELNDTYRNSMSLYEYFHTTTSEATLKPNKDIIDKIYFNSYNLLTELKEIRDDDDYRRVLVLLHRILEIENMKDSKYYEEFNIDVEYQRLFNEAKFLLYGRSYKGIPYNILIEIMKFIDIYRVEIDDVEEILESNISRFIASQHNNELLESKNGNMLFKWAMLFYKYEFTDNEDTIKYFINNMNSLIRKINIKLNEGFEKRSRWRGVRFLYYLSKMDLSTSKKYEVLEYAYENQFYYDFSIDRESLMNERYSKVIDPGLLSYIMLQGGN